MKTMPGPDRRVARALPGLKNSSWQNAAGSATHTDSPSHCGSYSPLLTRFKTLNPAFFASEMESGLSFSGELNVEMILRTGFLQAGHCVNGAALSGRRSVNLPPHTLHSPSHNSYS